MPTGFGASAEAEGLLMTKGINENAKQGKQRAYKLTFLACVACIANQAVVASIVALLFTTFMDLYGFEVWQLGVFVGVNFVAQLLADIILTATIDKLSYRKTALTSASLSAAVCGGKRTDVLRDAAGDGDFRVFGRHGGSDNHSDNRRDSRQQVEVGRAGTHAFVLRLGSGADYCRDVAVRGVRRRQVLALHSAAVVRAPRRRNNPVFDLPD